MSQTTAESLKSDVKTIMIIYTGGTMGMRESEDGSLAPSPGYLSEQINQMSELGQNDMPKFVVKEYEELIDSACMGPHHWVQIATDIEENYLSYDGFVVIMGTDTMAYAASALSFMLENLGKTVVFTGSQIPFCEVYNDARRNLIVAMIFAANSDIPEVVICFNDKILRGNRTMKVNSLAFDAFDSPNFPPLAMLGANIKKNNELLLSTPREKLVVHKKLDAGVLVLKLVPGFDDEAISSLVRNSNSLKAIVLELYGTGNGPSKKDGLLDAIRHACSRGIVVVVLSQCLRGGVSLSKYSMGKEFTSAGVVSGGDMTTEACTTKLAYLWGRLRDQKLVTEAITRNIRGEMSPPELETSLRSLISSQIQRKPILSKL